MAKDIHGKYEYTAWIDREQARIDALARRIRTLFPTEQESADFADRDNLVVRVDNGSTLPDFVTRNCIQEVSPEVMRLSGYVPNEPTSRREYLELKLKYIRAKVRQILTGPAHNRDELLAFEYKQMAEDISREIELSELGGDTSIPQAAENEQRMKQVIDQIIDHSGMIVEPRISMEKGVQVLDSLHISQPLECSVSGTRLEAMAYTLKTRYKLKTGSVSEWEDLPEGIRHEFLQQEHLGIVILMLRFMNISIREIMGARGDKRGILRSSSEVASKFGSFSPQRWQAVNNLINYIYDKDNSSLWKKTGPSRHEPIIGWESLAAFGSTELLDLLSELGPIDHLISDDPLGADLFAPTDYERIIMYRASYSGLLPHLKTDRALWQTLVNRANGDEKWLKMNFGLSWTSSLDYEGLDLFPE
ncbi:MAG: hypothetical protein COY80_01105 [Candidatus Pacebacteria bacterium CG_4_10_14_0_8_um_filter_42_14]|nr:MAG: hypothetical protein COY80_01105 [Candidatus Pacebacteria bacterium CG_4_10_14_0_8_um_filter_42_14]